VLQVSPNKQLRFAQLMTICDLVAVGIPSGVDFSRAAVDYPAPT